MAVPRRLQPRGNPLLWVLLINGLFWGGLFGSEELVHRFQNRRDPKAPASKASTNNREVSAALQLLQSDPSRQAGPPGPASTASTRLPDSPAPAGPLIGPEPGFAPSAAAPATHAASERAAAAANPWAAPSRGLPAAAMASLPLQGADALGGEVTLAGLGEPRMLPAARAELLRWQRSGNPLSPLPLHWQQRLRRQIAAGSTIQRAEVVRLPVPELQQREEVAVLIDDSGSAQALNTPNQQPVREAVEAWASRQQPAEAGAVQAVVIAAEPLPQPLPQPTLPQPPLTSEFSPAPAPEGPAGP